MARPYEPPPDPKVETPEQMAASHAALAQVLTTLSGLHHDGRQRVLAAARVFYRLSHD